MTEIAPENTRRRRHIDELLDAPPPQPSPGPPIADEERVLRAPVPESANGHAVPDGWLDLEAAPDTGRPVWLIGLEGQMVEAFWRHTRRFDAQGGGIWREYGFWAIRNGGGQKVPWDAIGWKPA
jgi:hypothetical protein